MSRASAARTALRALAATATGAAAPASSVAAVATAAACSFAPSSSCLASASASFVAQPSRGFAAGASTTDLTSEIEHATGLERDELLSKASGKDLFHEDWLDAPWGTAEAPVVVTSSFSERVVGVPDSYDDSIVWWGTIKEGEGPRQLVEGGEYFVLKRVGDGGGHH